MMQLGSWVLTLAVATASGPSPSGAGAPETAACAVTTPNGRGYVSAHTALRHGNEWLATSVSSPVVFRPGGPGCVDSDGTLRMKWPWWRKVRGSLQVETRRLDGDGPRARARIPFGYGDTGFQVTAVGFPGPGCWEVTGRVGEGILSFVTVVEKVGDGPMLCADRNDGMRERRPARD